MPIAPSTLTSELLALPMKSRAFTRTAALVLPNVDRLD